MQRTADQLAEEVMQLPIETRALLIDKIVESLDLDQPDEIQRLWAAEAIRRRDEIESGKAQTIDGEQVISEARRLVGR